MGLAVEASAGTAITLRGTRAHLRGLSLTGTGRHGLSVHSSRVELTGGSRRQIHATAREAALSHGVLYRARPPRARTQRAHSALTATA